LVHFSSAGPATDHWQSRAPRSGELKKGYPNNTLRIRGLAKDDGKQNTRKYYATCAAQMVITSQTSPNSKVWHNIATKQMMIHPWAPQPFWRQLIICMANITLELTIISRYMQPKRGNQQSIS